MSARAAGGFLANLGLRVATALVVLPALLAALFLGPPAVVVAIVAAAVALGMAELNALLEAAGSRPFRGIGWFALAALFVETARPGAVGAPLGPLAVVLLALAALRRGADLPAAVSGLASTLLGATYLGVLGGAMAALRLLEPAEQGAWRLVLLLATVMVADTAAFFVGHAAGRHILAPSLSPGKTVEGAIGGLAGGAAGAWAVRSLGLASLPVSHALVLGVLVAALGTAGDLFESLLKRRAGVKDSGALFPGHGGMLDRLDSLLFGAPVLYCYFLWLR